MMEGQWYGDIEGKCYSLRLGDVFRAEIYRGGSGIEGEWGSAWRATLNGRLLTASGDLEYCKAIVDWNVANEVQRMAEGYKAIKRRQLPSEDLYSADGWAKRKRRLWLLANAEGPTELIVAERCSQCTRPATRLEAGGLYCEDCRPRPET